MYTVLHLKEPVPLVGIHSKIQPCSVPYLHMECMVVRMLLSRLNDFEDRIDILHLNQPFCFRFHVSKSLAYLTDDIAGICIQLIWSEIIPVLYRIELISILTSRNNYFKDKNRLPRRRQQYVLWQLWSKWWCLVEASFVRRLD